MVLQKPRIYRCGFIFQLFDTQIHQCFSSRLNSQMYKSTLKRQISMSLKKGKKIVIIMKNVYIFLYRNSEGEPKMRLPCLKGC